MSNPIQVWEGDGIDHYEQDNWVVTFEGKTGHRFGTYFDHLSGGWWSIDIHDVHRYSHDEAQSLLGLVEKYSVQEKLFICINKKIERKP